MHSSGALFMITFFSVAYATEPFCRCTREYNPVCGSNGVTYGNTCLLQCANSEDPSITKVKDGCCKREEGPCYCALEYIPVCGSNGVTYSNKCFLDYASFKDPSIKMVKDGPCKSEENLNNEL